MVSSFSAQTLFPLQFHPPLRLKVLSAHRQRPSSSQQPSPSPENTDAKALRGSDILQALHRATAVPKGKKNMKNKKNMTRPQRNSSQQQLLDDDDIRPINIRSDWEGRITELETRLQQLQSQYHY